MSGQIARTVAEAESQKFTLPTTSAGWVEFAHMIDGYRIAEELGIDYRTLRAEKVGQFEVTGQWDLTVLEARILLFLEARADRHMGGVGEPTPMVDEWMGVIAEATGQAYASGE